MATHSINLETISWEATDALIKLDETYVGTPSYLGMAYFWAYEYRHYMRDASIAQRVKVHKKWLKAGLDFLETSQHHWDIIGEVLKKDVPNLDEEMQNEIDEQLGEEYGYC